MKTYSNKLGNLEEMDNFFDIDDQSKSIQAHKSSKIDL